MSRLAGVALLALVLLPWYRLTAWRAAGPSVDQTLRLGGAYLLAHWWGLVLGVVLTLVLGRLLRGRIPSVAARAVDRWLLRPTPRSFGLALAALAGGISLWVAVGVLGGAPVLLDGIGQLIQARYIAAGMWNGPELAAPEFWQFQFMVLADGRWVSQYPPGFALALAAAQTLDAAWLLGPLLLALSVYLIVQVAERLFPADRATARVGAVLTALSPFLGFHAGAYMSHVAALALVTLALWSSLRALDGSWRWALASGAAVGALLATRPYVGLALGPVVTVMVWACAPGRGSLALGPWLRRLGATAAGAAPFVVALLAYNARLFGSPTRFGYLAAAGPSHGLGFHVDPWGNPYGPVEALGHTSSDLLGLSVELLQTPLPAALVLGLYLAWRPAIDRSTLLVGLWALVPLAAGALYWHHDLFMGPRLLYEAAPAWCFLVAAACVGVLRRLPDPDSDPHTKGGTGTTSSARAAAPAARSRRRLAHVFTRAGFAATLALMLLVGLVYAAPSKIRSYAATAARSDMSVRAPAVDTPTLVFVHDSWASRLGSRLSALGMRLDSARAAMRLNTTCDVERFVAAREEEKQSDAPAAPPPVALRFEGDAPPSLRELVLPSGARILTYPGETLAPRCEREAASDYAGVVSLPPLLWQGDLPGLDSGGAMFVRDHGPERNAQLLELHPHREPALLARRGSARPRLVPYESGMEELWVRQR